MGRHGSKKPDENYTDEERRTICLVLDVLLSVGATWNHARIELFRVASADHSPFKRVPSQSTLERMILEEFECDSLTEYYEKRRDGLKTALKNKAVQMALSGNPSMLIFCLKNICGWSDNVQVVPDKEDAKNQIRLAYNPKTV